MANTAENPLPIGHELTEGEPHHAVIVYGTSHCGDTTRARALLDQHNVPYNYYDIDQDAALARTASALQNGGEKIPVVDFGGGTVLIEPANDELLQTLQNSGRLPKPAPTQV